MENASMFLPNDYKPPSNGGSANYVKLKDGENRFRILSLPILGWLDWTLQKQPLRFRFNAKPAKSIDPEKPVKHFWAMIVWDYEGDGAIKIWEVTQKKLMASLEELSKSPDWGAPFFYDVKVLRSGKDLETSYTVIPVPPKALHPKIEEEFRAKPCWLEALFDGEDPWNTALHRQSTKGIFSPSEVDTRNQEKERSLLTQLEQLSWSNGINPEKIPVYVGIKAAEKRKSLTEVVESALLKEFSTPFLTGYQRWMESQQPHLSKLAEQVPF